MTSALKTAAWISGLEFDYGPDNAGYFDEHHNHIVKTDFDCDTPEGATLEIASLGYRVTRINGQRVGKDELAGAWTRFDKLVYFDRYDISDLLVAGKNSIEIELGNGWYNPAPIFLQSKQSLRDSLSEVGTPQVLAAVVAADGTTLTCTDASWIWREGQLTFNNLYLGEHRDLGFEGVERGAVVARPNTRVLAPSVVPGCSREGVVMPGAAREFADGILIDMGQMIAGIIEFHFHARAGQKVTINYAEQLDEEGRLLFAENELIQQDILTCIEGKNFFTNEFCWHSFRYAFVEGLSMEDFERFDAYYVHTALIQTGDIVTDNASYQQLFDAARRTKLNCIHGIWENSAFDRFGYGGDMAALFNSNAFLFDTEGLLDKTLGDFSRDQTARGGVPATVPGVGVGTACPAPGEGPLLWQLAYPYLAVRADQWYGRKNLLEREWLQLERFSQYLLSFDPAELAQFCLGDVGGISDSEGETPDREFVGWCAIFWALSCVDEVANRLGKQNQTLEAAIEKLHKQIVERFAHADGSFGDGTQTSYAFAAALGLGDRRKLSHKLAEAIRANDGVVSCGMFGSVLAFDMLNRFGLDEFVEGWLLREQSPSFLDMLSEDSGSLKGVFGGHIISRNHAMMSGYVQWMAQALGGIRVADDAQAANHLVISPFFSPKTNSLTCSYVTPRGQVCVSWERQAAGIALTVTVPAGTAADVWVDGAINTLPADDAPITQAFFIEA